LSLAASIIKSAILFLLIFFHSKISSEEMKQYNPDDQGVLSIMYHRFEENKYPSTNIKINIFLQHLDAVKKNGFEFYDPKLFSEQFNIPKDNKRILLTIDDAFLSFYENAWPILKKKKIPFILFVNTREVGSFNYMNWDQITELYKSENVEIGNHSHSHEYLVEKSSEEIKADIIKSINIFKKKLGENSDFFSYPFGEYSFEFKKIIKDLGFKYAFGQHSGVIDETKDLWELPRFPINEKYGEIERFKTLMRTLPLKYKKILPEDKYLLQSKNPPKIEIEFYEDIDNLDQINCFSNEGNKWRNSKLTFASKNILKIEIVEKFVGERGRVNCSLKEKDGYWRWLGMQYVVSEK